ncbi:MAG: DNA repair protein RecN [Scytolyngbya sp. HA4215-MV1]|jgi:DNA repair protein RecN (Recombination protein N)|nr:DNA repair protein RecN [Scytolyngbya sp. HA4215-MV1]
MLQSLRIENFALIDHLELKLESGLNVLTGETGAGKSIILDAIDAALGGKVNSRAVRTGEDRALVEATFQLDPPVAAWLATQQIELLDEKSLVCSREITTSQNSQRSRSRLNGVVVNKQQMETVRDQLVEITAQGQTVQIGQPMMQREWLDSFGGGAVLQQRAAVATAFAAYQQAQQALEKRRQSEQQRLQQLDLFEYQLRELNTANLDDPDELNQLEQERKRLSHSVELQQQSYQVYQALYQNDGDTAACADLLGKAETALSDMLEYDEQLQPILDLVSSALAQVQEAGRQINAYGESLETDPQRLQEVQERIGELKQICRKYGPTLTEAIALQQQLQTDLAGLTGDGQSLEALEETFQQRQQALTEACTHLTHLRQTVAQKLEALLIEELKPLAMEKVKFQVGITPIPANATGADQITFLFSPNPGEPLQPLREIASGGEMSRFLLALQACFSQVDSVGTLVFDEIDVGVSGRVAQAIAEKLYQLGQRHQVLCVTHQPIIAAMADHHFHVSKQVIEPGNGKVGADSEMLPIESPKKKSKAKSAAEGSALPLAELGTADLRTVVRIVPLAIDQRREELAQLAGGQSAQEAIAFANSLLAQAATLRQSQVKEPLSVAQTESSLPPKARRSKSSKKV